MELSVSFFLLFFKELGLGRRTVVVVAVVVGVGVLSRADVVHLVGGTALHAAGLGLLADELQSLELTRRSQKQDKEFIR